LGSGWESLPEFDWKELPRIYADQTKTIRASENESVQNDVPVRAHPRSYAAETIPKKLEIL